MDIIECGCPDEYVEVDLVCKPRLSLSPSVSVSSRYISDEEKKYNIEKAKIEDNRLEEELRNEQSNKLYDESELVSDRHEDSTMMEKIWKFIKLLFYYF